MIMMPQSLILLLFYVYLWSLLMTITHSFVLTPNRYYNFSQNELYQIKVTNNSRPAQCKANDIAKVGHMVEIHYRGKDGSSAAIIINSW